MSMNHKLVYIHDPMCSWCWGFSRTLQRLIAALPRSIEVSRLLSGLAPDSNEPMPLEMRRQLQDIWKTIESCVPGTKFNHDFWTQCQPRRSTWPACRAVIAARRQGPEYDLAMTSAIQQGYYVRAKNPSDDATLIEFAEELGLNMGEFSTALNSKAVHQQLQQEIEMTQQLGIHGVPSLVLLNDTPNAITVDYMNVAFMLDSIDALMRNPTSG